MIDTMSKYIILNLVVVNRGQIEIGKNPDGQPKTAQHKPYVAGLILQDQTNFKRIFLDVFNAGYFLKEYFGYNNLPTGHPMRMLDLEQLVQTDEFRELRQYITVREVKDLEKTLKQEGIVHKRRNWSLSTEIAKQSSVTSL